MNSLVKLERRGRVAVITVDNPPVNAIAAGVLEGLESALAEAQADAGVDAIVVIGAGKTFIAGADLAEFAKTGKGPDLHKLLSCWRIVRSLRWWRCMGPRWAAGVEIAMAANYRVAASDAQLGMPEVTIGVVPGAEGTQRLPRLVGIAKAVDMLMTAAPVKAAEAVAIGLVDRVVDGDLLSGAVAFAEEMAARGGPHPKTRERRR